MSMELEYFTFNHNWNRENIKGVEFFKMLVIEKLKKEMTQGVPVSQKIWGVDVVLRQASYSIRETPYGLPRK